MRSIDPRNVNFDFLERRVGATSGLERAFALVDLAEAFFASRRFEQSLAAMTAAADVFRVEADDRQSAHCLRKAVYSLIELDRWEEAIGTAEEAKALYHQLGLNDDVALVEQLLGSLFWTVSRHDEAIESYQSAKHYFTAEGIPEEAASCAASVAGVYADIKAFDCALIELDIALEGFKKTECEECQAETVFRKADLLLEMQDLDGSAKAFRRAKRFYKSVGDDELAKVCDDRLKICKRELN